MLVAGNVLGVDLKKKQRTAGDPQGLGLPGVRPRLNLLPSVGREMQGWLLPLPRSSCPLERSVFKRETLQTAELSPSLARCSYCSEHLGEVIFSLPHEIVTLSPSHLSPPSSFLHFIFY